MARRFEGGRGLSSRTEKRRLERDRRDDILRSIKSKLTTRDIKPDITVIDDPDKEEE